jgi:predicted ATP-grasp superfamily ATP-dependent carboligase
MRKVLVTDASERAALAVIRSLGKKGIRVIAGDGNSLNAGFLSKYCWKRIRYHPPEHNKRLFVKEIISFLKVERPDLLIPVTDFSLIPLAENKEEIEKYAKLASPDYNALLDTYDKYRTFKKAKLIGVPVPSTHLLQDLGDEKGVKSLSETINYPAVIKPRMKPIWIGNKAIFLKVTEKSYVRTKQELIRRIQEMNKRLASIRFSEGLFIVQDYVEGEGYGVEALMDGSKPLAVFAHRRIREYPISGGASTLRESAYDKTLMGLGIKLLKGLQWRGIAMVEFKKKMNKAWMLEVNGRFWGSLPLSIYAGIDFPYLLWKYEMNEGEMLDRQVKYAVGLKHRWLIPGDIMWLYSSIKAKRNSAKCLKDFIESFAVPDDIISFRDLAPTIGAVATSWQLLSDTRKGKRSLSGETI